MKDFFAACDGCTVSLSRSLICCCDINILSQFDAQAVHWYDTSFDNFKSYINDYHNLFNLPIWVTEFAYQVCIFFFVTSSPFSSGQQSFTGGAQGSLSQIQDFMGQATSYMDSQDWVEYYCWFGAMHDMQNVNPLNQLMASDGGLTDLGRQFLSS